MLSVCWCVAFSLLQFNGNEMLEMEKPQIRLKIKNKKKTLKGNSDDVSCLGTNKFKQSLVKTKNNCILIEKDTYNLYKTLQYVYSSIY